MLRFSVSVTTIGLGSSLMDVFVISWSNKRWLMIYDYDFLPSVCVHTRTRVKTATHAQNIVVEFSEI